MLGKLLKYDYKAQALYFLLMYGVLGGISVIARISIAMADSRYSAFADNHVLSVMAVAGSVILYFLTCGAVMVLTLLLIAMRFYKNLMGPEGYLSFTIPVSAGAHLASKVISGVSLLLLSFLMVFASGLIVTLGLDFWEDQLLMFFGDIWHALRMDQILIEVLYLAEGFVTLVQTVAMIYFSICVGQLAAKHRILGAIGIFLAVNLVFGIVTTLGSVIFIQLLQGSEGTVFYYGVTGIATVFFRGLVSAGCLIGSLLLMKHKLNLE